MQEQRHYTKAPIIEALIDLRVQPLTEEVLPAIKSLQGDLSAAYPVAEEMFLAKGRIEAGSTVSATASTSSIGWRFHSQDNKQILQTRLDGFTFSQLEPYSDWMTLRDEAQKLWKIYIEAVRPKSIQRVAVRYINRLDLPLFPLKELDFKDYLRTIPEISPALPQGLSDYVMQLQIPQEDLGEGVLLALSEAMIAPSRENVVSVLLDIDLFKSVDIPANSSAAWSLLEKFRDRKNLVFEACITDKTRELLK